jgi:hypothetical protein
MPSWFGDNRDFSIRAGIGRRWHVRQRADGGWYRFYGEISAAAAVNGVAAPHGLVAQGQASFLNTDQWFWLWQLRALWRNAAMLDQRTPLQMARPSA